MSDADLIRRLRDELDEAREEIRQLRSILAPTTPLPSWAPYLTRQEETVFRLLMAREVLTLEAFEQYHLKSEYANAQNHLAIYIHKLRRKLKPLGARILTVWGRGYSLDLQGLIASEAA